MSFLSLCYKSARNMESKMSYEGEETSHEITGFQVRFGFGGCS